MEELIVHALLYSAGLEEWKAYSETLDRLFMENSGDGDLLDLEFSSDENDVISHTIALFDRPGTDTDVFGKKLTKALRDIYEREDTDLRDFDEKCLSLWDNLPDTVAYEKPFSLLTVAGDPLGWGDEQLCRQMYMRFFTYYTDQEQGDEKYGTR